METFVYYAAAATASRLIPITVGLTWRRSLSVSGRLLLLFIVLSLASDLGMILIGRVLRINNLWIQHLAILVQTPILLLAFASWARSASIQRALRVSAYVAVIVLLLITIVFESLTRFPRFTGTLEAALFCLAAIAVLIDRGLTAEAQVTRSDWFWVALGILLVHGLTAVHRPLLDLFTARGITTIPAWTVLKVLGVLQIIANLMFARAFFCMRREHGLPVPAPA